MGGNYWRTPIISSNCITPDAYQYLYLLINTWSNRIIVNFAKILEGNSSTSSPTLLNNSSIIYAILFIIFAIFIPFPEVWNRHQCVLIRKSVNRCLTMIRTPRPATITSEWVSVVGGVVSLYFIVDGQLLLPIERVPVWPFLHVANYLRICW